MVAMAVIVMAVAMGMISSGSASAASYAKGVYAPKATGESITGRANVNTDCADTFGCYTYIKLERMLDVSSSPSPVPWTRTWEQVAGKWASNGWNDVVFNNPVGCARYRTVVDSYNDSTGEALVGVSLGPVEVNLGGGVKRYHQTYRSSFVRICTYA